jgi:hypothetical protein
MPFRKGYEGVYDQATLERLQDILEFVWLAITDAVAPSISRDDLARLVLEGHEAGMSPDRIKEHVIRHILQPSGLQNSSKLWRGGSRDDINPVPHRGFSARDNPHVGAPQIAMTEVPDKDEP